MSGQGWMGSAQPAVHLEAGRSPHEVEGARTAGEAQGTEEEGVALSTQGEGRMGHAALRRTRHNPPPLGVRRSMLIS